MLISRLVFIVTFVSAVGLFHPSCAVVAQEPEQASIDRAHEFLGTRVTGNFVLSYVHFGATYNSHTLQSIRYVKDSDGDILPGRFAAVYRYQWETNGAGTTDIAFACDEDGDVYDVLVLSTDAVLQQPFLVADTTIQVLGNLFIEACKDQITSDDLQTIRRLVNAADSEGLLEFALVMRQAISR